MNWARYGLGLLLLGCTREPLPPISSTPFGEVKSFACQLQNLDPARIPSVDLLIMDPTRDGSALYSPRQMAGIKQQGRLLLAYLSIGEAENYRSYWDKSWKPGKPSWLGPTNPDWGGNYKVQFWDPGWRRIVRDSALTIQQQGFDGLFLDVVDGWEFWQKSHPQARQAMIDLVLEISQETRRRQPDFGIVLNGGDGLLDNRPLFEAITGVAKEEIFFGLGGDGKATPAHFTLECQNRLRPLVEAHKLVLSIDYTQDPVQKREAQKSALRAGYLEFIGARGLDRIPPQGF